MLRADEAPYQSCYCEENVYKLIETAAKIEGLFAVFISNDCQMVPLWCQKAGDSETGFIIWDYHVIAISKKRGGIRVYDHDSTLPWGIEFNTYWEKTMRANEQSGANMKRKFRIISGDTFLSLFASDRSHMKDIDGEFTKPPPEWPPINPSLPSNLLSLINMSTPVEGTEVWDEEQMDNFFSTKKRQLPSNSMDFIDPESTLTLSVIAGWTKRKKLNGSAVL